MIPSFLLAKLYVKGSLKNTDTRFEFALKNIIDSTMLIGIGPIIVGEKSYESEAINMIFADKTYNGVGMKADVPRKSSLPLRVYFGNVSKIIMRIWKRSTATGQTTGTSAVSHLLEKPPSPAPPAAACSAPDAIYSTLNALNESDHTKWTTHKHPLSRLRLGSPQHV